MGNMILQQRRGKGSATFKVKERCYSIKLSYPPKEGKGTIMKLLNPMGYTAPMVMIRSGNKTTFNVATKDLYEGQEIEIGKEAKIKFGNIIPLKVAPVGTEVCNIEMTPLGGGKIIRTSGSSATVTKRVGKRVALLLPSKKEVLFNEDCRATIGSVAGAGRTEKPIIKAGKRHFYLKSRSKHYPRTSPVKRNSVDHPFGGGRGKNMGKSSIAPRWSPPGRRVGLIRPRKTGRGGKSK